MNLCSSVVGSLKLACEIFNVCNTIRLIILRYETAAVCYLFLATNFGRMRSQSDEKNTNILLLKHTQADSL